MRPCRSARHRLVAGLSTAALACAVATAISAPAHADSSYGELQAAAGSSDSGGTCSGGTSDSTSASWISGGTTSRSIAVDGTVSDSGDAGDVTDYSASAQGKVTRSGASLTMSGSLSGSVDAAQGAASDCDVNASSSFTAAAYLNLDHAGWYSLSLVHPAGTIGVVLITDSTTMEVIHQSYDQESESENVWVGAGQYTVELQVTAEADDDSTTDSPTHYQGAFSGGVVYHPAGGAQAATSGSGRSMVRLGNGVNCTDHQVVAVFTKKAKGLKTATFTVNGKKRLTVKKPAPGRVVVLRTASPTSTTSVKATLVGKKKATVSRSYLACE